MFGNKKRKEEQAMNLLASGARGVGTLVDVVDTGLTVNDSIRVKMVFDVSPLDGSESFRAEKAAMVNRVRLPQMGAIYPILYDAADHSTFAYIDGVSDADGARNVVGMFGDAFGPDAVGVGRVPAVVVPAAAAPATADPLEQLRKLGELRDAGVLTDAEFATKKADLLAEI